MKLTPRDPREMARESMAVVDDLIPLLVDERKHLDRVATHNNREAIEARLLDYWANHILPAEVGEVLGYGPTCAANLRISHNQKAAKRILQMRAENGGAV